MFSFDTKVRYSETGEGGKLSAPAAINLFQDTFTLHGEALGLGNPDGAEKERVWVLNSWQILFRRMPAMGERIRVSTKCYDLKDFYDCRNFLILDEKEEVCIVASSLWVYMDVKRKRPVKFDTSVLQEGHVEKPYPMANAGRKVLLPGEPEDYTKCEEIKVKRSMIDTNSHVNNCEYVRMGLDLLPASFPEEKLRQVRVEYKKPAVLGDVIYPEYLHDKDEKKVYMALKDGSGNLYVGMEFAEEEYRG